MFELNAKLAKRWARMGPRALYGTLIGELAKRDDDILLLSADLGRSSGLSSFYTQFPERFVNVGISEQNMIGVAAGLTRQRFKIFASTFAPFATMRAAEQVRMNLGYMKAPVVLVGLGSGVAMGHLGNSHFGLEDLAIMRAIPNIQILTPADGFELYKMLEHLVNKPMPTYLRLTGFPGAPNTYTEDYNFEPGKPNWITEPTENTIVCSGALVGQANNAVDKLNEQGENISLLNIHTLAPLLDSTLSQYLSNKENIWVFEEHRSSGGLGTRIKEWYADNNRPAGNLNCYGLPDDFIKSGEPDFLLNEYSLNTSGILSAVNYHLSSIK